MQKSIGQRIADRTIYSAEIVTTGNGGASYGVQVAGIVAAHNVGGPFIDLNVKRMREALAKEIDNALAEEAPAAPVRTDGRHAAHQHCSHSPEQHEDLGWSCDFWPPGGPCCRPNIPK